jgi:hypothetical protein
MPAKNGRGILLSPSGPAAFARLSASAAAAFAPEDEEPEQARGQHEVP